MFINILFDKKTQYAIIFKMQLVSSLPHWREIWMYTVLKHLDNKVCSKFEKNRLKDVKVTDI